jgi:hypothetical protein
VTEAPLGTDVRVDPDSGSLVLTALVFVFNWNNRPVVPVSIWLERYRLDGGRRRRVRVIGTLVRTDEAAGDGAIDESETARASVTFNIPDGPRPNRPAVSSP